MKKTDKSQAKKDSKSQARFSRSDKLALIKEIHHMMNNFDYVSVNVFKESAERVSAAFLRGRCLPVEPYHELLSQLIQFARRSKSPEAEWFSTWVKKVHKADSEQLLSRQRGNHLEDVAKRTFKKLTIEIDGFGYVSASDFGSEVYLGSLAGFYHVFSDSDSLRSFALGLMGAATEIESSRTVIETKAVPEGYAQTVLADWSDQIVANAWLYPDKEHDDPK
jgi:hypothetical protein